jgi:hypothetical protein
MRCRHGFCLDTVACPAGCGGTDKSRHVAAPRVNPDKLERQYSQSFTDDQLRTVLTTAPSINAAGRTLCAQAHIIRDRARKTPELWKLFSAAAKRGRQAKKPDGWKDTR